MQKPNNIEKFTSAVNIISRLRTEGTLEVSFGLGRISLGGDEEVPEKILDEFNLTGEQFDEIIQEILMISYYILENNENNLISELRTEDKHIKEKVELLQNKFIDNKLRAKFLLNIAYKTNILDKFDWEIIKKIHKDYPKQLYEMPFAMMRFRIKHPFSDNPPVEKTETFVFEVTSEEIEELINELNEVKNQLHIISRGKPNV